MYLFTSKYTDPKQTDPNLHWTIFFSVEEYEDKTISIKVDKNDLFSQKNNYVIKSFLRDDTTKTKELFSFMDEFVEYLQNYYNFDIDGKQVMSRLQEESSMKSRTIDGLQEESSMKSRTIDGLKEKLEEVNKKYDELGDTCEKVVDSESKLNATVLDQIRKNYLSWIVILK